MPARGDASRCAFLIELADPADPRLADLAALLHATFPDPNSVLGLDRMQEFLEANRPDGPRRFGVLVARQNAAIVGGTVFSYVVRSNCGFSEYIVTDSAVRGRGIGRRLFEARKAFLDAEAQRHGQPRCRGLFIEVDNPERTPADYVEAERETALDPRQRLRIFDRFGFRRVDLAYYVQPPLAPGKRAVDYLDLLFAPWASDSRWIPSQWIFDTLDAIWSAWSPATAGTHLARLRCAVPGPRVALLPAAPAG
jgi:GNAT superfamily N-acetyltransferase